MAKPEFDPREVLERYVAVLGQPSVLVVRDVAELAHSKESIRSVLQHCIRTEADQDAREYLRNAYISLSSFQPISEADKEALAVLSEMGPIATEGSKLFDKQARQITHVAGPLRLLLDRVTAERAVLAQEIKTLADSE
jgi:hypothetical protein